MRIERLTATDVRNLHDVTLHPAPHLNLFQGPNGAGKTALLEAIYLLARGRSFRTPRVADVVRHAAERLRVSASVLHGDGAPVMTGVERGAGHLVLRYNGEAVRTVSAHARRFPLVVISPDSQQLVLGEPALRRDWLDWAMFHVEPAYLDHWRDYHRALRQRNRLLKNTASTMEMNGWEETMARSGAALDRARREFLARLQASFQDFAVGTWAHASELRLRSGWDAEMPLAEGWGRWRAADLQCGFTRQGPHRADIEFLCENNKLASSYSRGESKLFLCVLMLAEASVMAEMLGEPPVLLIDDFGAELDPGARAHLLGLLKRSRAQAFLTTTVIERPEALPEGALRFHVEQGRLLEMIE